MFDQPTVTVYNTQKNIHIVKITNEVRLMFFKCYTDKSIGAVLYSPTKIYTEHTIGMFLCPYVWKETDKTTSYFTFNFQPPNQPRRVEVVQAV